jgi:predicted transcriptional regulator of viral defense system
MGRGALRKWWNVGGASHPGRVADPRLPDSSRLAGVVTASELAAAGMSREQVQRLVRQGALRRLVRGGYAPAALVVAQSGDRVGEHAVLASAALAVAGPGYVVSHHSAALIHGLDLLGHRAGGPVAMTHARGGTSKRTDRPGGRLYVAALPAGHVVTRRGVSITSVARTVMDLARTSPFPAGWPDSVTLRLAERPGSLAAERVARRLRGPGGG